MKKSNSRIRIKELIEYFGITQAEFSRRTGIDKATVSLYLSGAREPAQNNISKIIEAFGVDPAWVMGYDIPMFNEKVKSNAKALEDGARMAKLTASLLSKVNDDDVDMIIKLYELPPSKRAFIYNQIDYLSQEDCS